MTFLLFFVVCVGADPWDRVREALEHWPLMDDFSFSAGDATGRKFTFERGNTTMQSVLTVASSSKFPVAVAIAGLVAENIVSFDDLACNAFDWWTCDAADRRSAVSLRHLLTFTSGFYYADETVTCLSEYDDPAAAYDYTLEGCASMIYEKAPFPFVPGSTFDYNSYHLQVAGAMVTKMAGINVTELLDMYLFDKVGMPSSYFEPEGAPNPQLAANLMVNGDDYDTFLRAVLAYRVLPKTILDQMEADALAGDVAISNSSWFNVHSLGHYSMCNWYECLFNYGDTFRQECTDANLHVDAGLFGWYPVVDRGHATYFQIVQSQIPVSAKKADLWKPTIDAVLLRLRIKPLVDAALAAQSAEPTTE